MISEFWGGLISLFLVFDKEAGGVIFGGFGGEGGSPPPPRGGPPGGVPRGGPQTALGSSQTPPRRILIRDTY
jgi:hypothetical protein